MPAPVQNLTITFVDLCSIDDILTLSFWGDHPTDSVEFVRGEVFQDARINPGQTTIGTSNNDQATLYGNAFVLDYGGNFEVVVVDNVVYMRTMNGSDIFNYSYNGKNESVIFGEGVPPEPAIVRRDTVVRSPYLALSQDTQTFDTTVFNIKVYNGLFDTFIDVPVRFSKIKKKVQRLQSIVYSNISYLVREGFSADIDYYLANQHTLGPIPIRETEGKWCAVEMVNKLFDTVQHTTTQHLYITDGYINNNEVQANSLNSLFQGGITKSISMFSPERCYFKMQDLVKIGYYVSSDPSTEHSCPSGTLSFDPNLSTDYIASVGVVDNATEVDILSEKWIKYVAIYSIGGEPFTMSKKYFLITECQNEVWDLIFKDKTGFLQTLPLTKKSVKNLTVTSEDYSRNIVDINGSYNPLRHTTKQFNTNGGEQWTLNTDYIPEFNNDVIRQAMLSEEMWIRSQSTFEVHPVTRVDDTVTFKTQYNDKLINYTLKVKLSHKTIKSFK
jgi:hypothetical protein